MFEGRVRFRQKKENDEWGEWFQWRHNLFVDDGKELTLDFLFGRMSWWNPMDKEDYVGGDSGWDTTRWVEIGDSMFNNKSREFGSGIKGIPVGQEWNYKIADTFLVEPTDSFITTPVGSRVQLNALREDQHMQFRATFDSPGDIPTGTNIREVGIFLKAAGPLRDPSLHQASKAFAMLSRSPIFGSGYFNATGQEGSQGDPGFEPCFKDNPIFVTNDIELEWEFGELPG